MKRTRKTDTHDVPTTIDCDNLCGKLKVFFRRGKGGRLYCPYCGESEKQDKDEVDVIVEFYT